MLFEGSGGSCDCFGVFGEAVFGFGDSLRPNSCGTPTSGKLQLEESALTVGSGGGKGEMETAVTEAECAW